MAEQSSPEFKPHETLEADIKHLAQEIHRNREWAEAKGISDKELLRQTIRAMTPTPPPSGDGTQPSPGPLPAYAEDAPPETKLEIEYLLDLAFHKGIAAANSAAAKSSPFILDAFHDALVGKLYPEMQKRGLLPK